MNRALYHILGAAYVALAEDVAESPSNLDAHRALEALERLFGDDAAAFRREVERHGDALKQMELHRAVPQSDPSVRPTLAGAIQALSQNAEDLAGSLDNGGTNSIRNELRRIAGELWALAERSTKPIASESVDALLDSLTVAVDDLEAEAVRSPGAADGNVVHLASRIHRCVVGLGALVDPGKPKDSGGSVIDSAVPF